MKSQMAERVVNQSERGQSLTELAISLVFMLILLAGVVDLGRAFFTYITLRDAVQEGALYGTYEPSSCSAIETRVRTTANTPVNLSSTAITVGCTVDKACAGGNIKVSATYKKFPITMPFLGTLVGRQEFDISASVIDTVVTPVKCPSP